ncbi:SDR family oxidoreductase, partial [Mycobacterium timonense]
MTGATGSVGIGLLLEMLKSPSTEIVCLVRGSDDDTAQRRLRSSLLEAAEVYECAELAAAITTRCRAVAG